MTTWEEAMKPANFTIPPIESEEALMERMTVPSAEVIEAVSQLHGDVMILGVSGKMGPSLARLLVRAGAPAVIGVSRFSDPASRDQLESIGVRTVKCDLLEDRELQALPDASHLFVLAGFKFGATGNEPITWAANTLLPARVMQRFPDAKIVYISSGNVYRYTLIMSGGAKETDPLEPIGEYAQSRLGGERVVQFYAERNGTPTLIVRLFYATELRYGVILDLAQKISAGIPIDLTMGYVNQIWQGDAVAWFARSFPFCAAPARILNVTGPETLSVRELAERLGALMGVPPRFGGQESDTALLGNGAEAVSLFGAPTVSPEEIVEWVAWWAMHGKSTLNKPTKYESRTGTF